MLNIISRRALDSQADLERQQNDLRSYQNRVKRVLGMEKWSFFKILLK